MNLQMYDFFKELEGYIVIDWDEKLNRLRELAYASFVSLYELSVMIDYRENARKKKAKRINSSALRKFIEEHYSDGILVNCVYDRLTRDEKLTREACIIIIDTPLPKFPPDLRENLKLHMACAALLCEIFESFVGKDPLQKVTLQLQETLYYLTIRVIDTYNNFRAEEQLSDQKSGNQKKSDKKEQRLEALKLHPKYPELFEAIKKYRHSDKGKDKSALNKLLTEMTEIKNQVTIRHYRNCLLEEYLNSEK